MDASCRQRYPENDKKRQHVRKITANDHHFYCTDTAQDIKPPVCVCVCVSGPSAQQSDTSLPSHEAKAHFPRMSDDSHLVRILHFIAADLPEHPPPRLHAGESADPLLN